MGRFILHSDLNNFYASVESLYNPSIRNKAVVVVGDEEKRHGIELSSERNSKPVLQFTIEGEFIRSYSSASEASRQTGICNIGKCCKGRYKTAGGFIWRFAE